MCHLGERTLECVNSFHIFTPYISLTLSLEGGRPTYKGVHS